MKIRIERLKPNDWQEFCHLFKQLLKEDFPAYPRETKERFFGKIKEGFEGKKRFFWVAKVDKGIVGFLTAKGTPGGVSFINWLGVAKDFRHQGIGLALVQVWQNWARKKGYHKIRVSTNLRNQGFYKKLGFSLEGTMKSDAYGVDRLVFGKIIGQFKR
jgi:ribosomal protein S18 acetylase RimI-like enzyme